MAMKTIRVSEEIHTKLSYLDLKYTHIWVKNIKMKEAKYNGRQNLYTSFDISAVRS